MFRSVQQAQESVDSRSSVAGGRQMSTAELAQMEAALRIGPADVLSTLSKC